MTEQMEMKIFLAVCTTLIAVVCMLAAYRYPEYQGAWIVGAVVFLVIVVLLLWSFILEGYTAYNESITEFAIALSKLDHQGREMLGFQFPNMRYVMERGVVNPTFENTGVHIDLFREFMLTSKPEYISPERDWCTSEKPHSAWVKIADYLIENGDVSPNSAMGNKSLLWKSRSVYRRYCAYWVKGREIPDLNDVEAV